MAYPSSVNVCFDDHTYKLKYVQTPCSQIYVDLLDTADALTGSRKNFIKQTRRCLPEMNKDALGNLNEELGKVYIFSYIQPNFVVCILRSLEVTLEVT